MSYAEEAGIKWATFALEAPVALRHRCRSNAGAGEPMHAPSTDPGTPAEPLLHRRRVLPVVEQTDHVDGSRGGPGSRLPLLGPPQAESEHHQLRQSG